jgi:hypothetical protein
MEDRSVDGFVPYVRSGRLAAGTIIARDLSFFFYRVARNAPLCAAPRRTWPASPHPYAPQQSSRRCSQCPPARRRLRCPGSGCKWKRLSTAPRTQSLIIRYVEARVGRIEICGNMRLFRGGHFIPLNYSAKGSAMLLIDGSRSAVSSATAT